MNRKKEATAFVDETLNKMRNFLLVKERKTLRLIFAPREIRLALSMCCMQLSGHR